MATTYTEREKDELRAGMHLLGCDHCKWGDPKAVSKGLPCCTYIGGPSVRPDAEWRKTGRLHRCLHLRWRRGTRQ